MSDDAKLRRFADNAFDMMQKASQVQDMIKAGDRAGLSFLLSATGAVLQTGKLSFAGELILEGVDAPPKSFVELDETSRSQLTEMIPKLINHYTETEYVYSLKLLTLLDEIAEPFLASVVARSNSGTSARQRVRAAKCLLECRSLSNESKRALWMLINTIR